MLTVALIGANGFLGSHLIEKAISLNEKINWLPIINKNSHNLPEGITTYSVKEFLAMPETAFDVILFAPGSFKDTKAQQIALNIELVLKIKQQFYNKRFVFISSTNVYGNVASPINKLTKLDISSAYAHSKLCGEFLASSFESYAILRFTYLYGPRLNNGSFLPVIINAAKTNKNITLFNNGERIQDYLFIDDAVNLCFKAIKSKKNATVLGVSSEKTSNKKAATLISNHIANCVITYVKKEESVINFIFEKTENVFNWSPKVSFKDGIATMINHTK